MFRCAENVAGKSSLPKLKEKGGDKVTNFVVILKLLSVVVSLVSGAEALITGRGRGAEKKNMVMKGISGAVSTLATVGVVKKDEEVGLVEAFGGVVDEVVSFGKSFNEASDPGKSVSP